MYEDQSSFSSQQTTQVEPVPVPQTASVKTKILAPGKYAHKHYGWFLILGIVVLIVALIFIYRQYKDKKAENRLEYEITVGAELLNKSTNPTDAEKSDVAQDFLNTNKRSATSDESESIVDFLNS